MKPEFPDPRAELEAKVTALLLGELNEQAVAELRQVMAQDVELKKLHDRLKVTMDLVRETAVTPAGELAEPPVPLKLSPARREALLAQFKTVTPRELAKPRVNLRKWAVPLAAAAAVAILAALVVAPRLRHAEFAQRLALWGTFESAMVEDHDGDRTLAEISPRKPTRLSVASSTPPVQATPKPTGIYLGGSQVATPGQATEPNNVSADAADRSSVAKSENPHVEVPKGISKDARSQVPGQSVMTEVVKAIQERQAAELTAAKVAGEPAKDDNGAWVLDFPDKTKALVPAVVDGEQQGKPSAKGIHLGGTQVAPPGQGTSPNNVSPGAVYATSDAHSGAMAATAGSFSLLPSEEHPQRRDTDIGMESSAARERLAEQGLPALTAPVATPTPSESLNRLAAQTDADDDTYLSTYSFKLKSNSPEKVESKIRELFAVTGTPQSGQQSYPQDALNQRAQTLVTPFLQSSNQSLQTQAITSEDEFGKPASQAFGANSRSATETKQPVLSLNSLSAGDTTARSVASTKTGEAKVPVLGDMALLGSVFRVTNGLIASSPVNPPNASDFDLSSGNFDLRKDGTVANAGSLAVNNNGWGYGGATNGPVVYSQNAVGYVNITNPAHNYELIQDQERAATAQSRGRGRSQGGGFASVGGIDGVGAFAGEFGGGSGTRGSGSLGVNVVDSFGTIATNSVATASSDVRQDALGRRTDGFSAAEPQITAGFNTRAYTSLNGQYDDDRASATNGVTFYNKGTIANAAAPLVAAMDQPAQPPAQDTIADIRNPHIEVKSTADYRMIPYSPAPAKESAPQAQSTAGAAAPTPLSAGRVLRFDYSAPKPDLHANGLSLTPREPVVQGQPSTTFFESSPVAMQTTTVTGFGGEVGNPIVLDRASARAPKTVGQLEPPVSVDFAAASTPQQASTSSTFTNSFGLATQGRLAEARPVDSRKAASGSSTFTVTPPPSRSTFTNNLPPIIARAARGVPDEHFSVRPSQSPPAVIVAPPPPSSRPAAQKTDDLPAAEPAVPPPPPQPEVLTRDNAFSTFSLNVSDVSFKLAQASLANGKLPDAASVRSEEFINAFNYRDPEPAPGAPIGFASERAAYPFAHNRDLLRFSVKAAALGRTVGRPLNLVLLLDKSGSMERADRVAIIREALRVLAAQLQPQDTLSVVVFARTASLWADGVSGSKAGELVGALSGLTPEGGTNLEEAMKLAYATALRHYLANGENRVVILTDGAANLGNVEPDALKQSVESHRAQGIALDCFGIGWEDYNDTLLETLSRNGGGRYGFINTPTEAATEFAGQLAGALRVAASDVKVQVEFNPRRVTSYRQIGYAKDKLTKEQFRDNTVKAAQIAARESGNALYTVEVNPAGDGPICTVHVRYRAPGTSDYYEHEWAVPYTGASVALDQASPAMRLAAVACAFSEWLATSPYAGEVMLDPLLGYLRGVPQVYGADTRPAALETMIREAKSISGK